MDLDSVIYTDFRSMYNCYSTGCVLWKWGNLTALFRNKRFQFLFPILIIMKYVGNTLLTVKKLYAIITSFFKPHRTNREKIGSNVWFTVKIFAWVISLSQSILQNIEGNECPQFLIGYPVLVAKCMGKLEVILEFSLAFDSTKNTLRQRNDSCKYFHSKSNITIYFLSVCSMRKLKKEVIIALKFFYSKQSTTYIFAFFYLTGEVPLWAITRKKL